MNQKEMIETLRKEVTNNSALGDVMHDFAIRKRTRSQVTITALEQRMIKDGFTHKRTEYVDALKLLSHLGVGRLEVTSKGKITALKDIKVTLQSLGKAVCQGSVLKTVNARNKYGMVSGSPTSPNPNPNPIAPVIPLPPKPMPAPKPPAAVAGIKLVLTVLINGKAVSITVPRELNKEEVAHLISKFQESA